MKVDSIDKVIKYYFAAVTNQSYLYKDFEYTPRALHLYPTIAAESTCTLGCGACCYKFGLDYLPDEPHPDGVEERFVEFNGSKYLIFTDFQKNHTGKYCRHLTDTAACGIHGMQPFTCDFELLKAFTTKKESKILVTSFMNAHRMCRYPIYLQSVQWKERNGLVYPEYQPFCKINAPSQAGAMETLRKLKRLKAWTDYFGIETYLPEIFHYLETNGWRSGRAIFSSKSIKNI